MQPWDVQPLPTYIWLPVWHLHAFFSSLHMLLHVFLSPPEICTAESFKTKQKNPPLLPCLVGYGPLPSLAPSAPNLSLPRLAMYSLALTPAKSRLLCQPIVWEDTRSSDGSGFRKN